MQKQACVLMRRLTRKTGVAQPGAMANGEGKGVASSEGVEGKM